MSIIKHKNQRVAVFIDTQNLYHSARNLYNGLRVNFKGVLEESVSGRQIVRALAYVITTEAGDEANFFDALTKIGIETKTKDLQIFFGGNKKADWDVGMAVDAIKIANKVDVVILATGDGDFVPLVEYLKNSVQVEVISFGKSSSSALRASCDDFIDMSENPEKYLIGFKNNFKSNRNKNTEKRPMTNVNTNASTNAPTQNSVQNPAPAQKPAVKRIPRKNIRLEEERPLRGEKLLGE